MIGIYCYQDTLNNDEIVYIGKDSQISKNHRNRCHRSRSCYNKQPINKILQNNPRRYKYKVLKTWKKEKYHNNLVNALEMIYIHRYRPKFNFTAGGEGMWGYKMGEKTKKKISKSNKGRVVSEETRQKISNALKGKTFSDERKRVLSEAHKGHKLSEETKQKLSAIRKGVKKSEEHKRKIAIANTKEYPRVVRGGFDENGKQIYMIYRNGKRLTRSVSLDKLKRWFDEHYPNEILKCDFCG